MISGVAGVKILSIRLDFDFLKFFFLTLFMISNKNEGFFEVVISVMPGFVRD